MKRQVLIFVKNKKNKEFQNPSVVIYTILGLFTIDP